MSHARDYSRAIYSYSRGVATIQPDKEVADSLAGIDKHLATTAEQ